MDLQEAIRQLRMEKERLEAVIVNLERLQGTAADHDADASVKATAESRLRKRRGSCRPSAGRPSR